MSELYLWRKEESRRMNTAIKKFPIASFRVLSFMAALCIFLSGCSMFYYGHTKEEWNQFSEAEKIEAKKEYRRIVETKKEQEAEDTINNRTQSIIDYGTKSSTL